MLRRIVYYSAAVSLLLWLTLWGGWAAMKVRPSLRHRTWIGLEFDRTACHVRLTRSGLLLTRTTYHPQEPWTGRMDSLALRNWQKHHLSFERRGEIFACSLWRGSRLFTFHEVAFQTYIARWTGEESSLHVPRWLASLVTVLLPLLVALRILQRQLRRAMVRPGCCLSCGYDLRASRDRCPECGTPMAGAAPTTA